MSKKIVGRLIANGPAKVAALVGLGLGSSMAMAASEGGDIAGLITAAAVTIAAICTAWLAAHASIKIFRLIKAAF